MHQSPDLAALWMATICADLIVLGGWLAAASVVIVGVNRRVRRLTAGLPADAPDEAGDMKIIAYAASCVTLIAGIGFGIMWLQKPGTARAGRVCIWLALAQMTLAVLAAIAIVLAMVAYFPTALAPR